THRQPATPGPDPADRDRARLPRRAVGRRARRTRRGRRPAAAGAALVVDPARGGGTGRRAPRRTARAGRAPGRRRRPGRHRPAGAVAAQRPTPGRSATLGHCRGLLAADPALVRAAADAYDRIDLPLHRAQALENAAVLLAHRDDTAAAHTAYTGAIELYTRFG